MLVVTVGHAAGEYDGAGHAERGRGVAAALALLHLGPGPRLAVAVVEVGVDHLHQLLLRLSGHRRGTQIKLHIKQTPNIDRGKTFAEEIGHDF